MNLSITKLLQIGLTEENLKGRKMVKLAGTNPSYGKKPTTISKFEEDQIRSNQSWWDGSLWGISEFKLKELEIIARYYKSELVKINLAINYCKERNIKSYDEIERKIYEILKDIKKGNMESGIEKLKEIIQ